MENKDKIRIDCRLYVDKNMRYEERAKLLLDRAITVKKGIRKPGYTDDKQLVFDVKGIESLIGAGAEIIKINYPQITGGFIHEVAYREHRFIAVTDEPHFYTINAFLR